MNTLLFLLALFFSVCSFGQRSILPEVDSINKRISQLQLSKNSELIRFEKKGTSFGTIRYEYSVAKGDIERLIRKFKLGLDSVTHEFYFKGRDLIFGTELLETYFDDKDKEPGMTWHGSFYFSKGRLIYHETLGHGKSELEEWDPKEEWRNYYKEALQHLKESVEVENGS